MPLKKTPQPTRGRPSVTTAGTVRSLKGRSGPGPNYNGRREILFCPITGANLEAE